MEPERPLPYHGDFASAEDYVEQLLRFATTSDMFRLLCGGVHILDFFTSEPGLFYAIMPADWQPFLLSCDITRLLDLLLRADLENLGLGQGQTSPPQSFLDYVRVIRKFALGRTFTPPKVNLPVLPRSVAVGMKPKKIHEVSNFADYATRLADGIGAESDGQPVSHFVDFGSGQNYLGRALASEPYNRNVVAVEGRENNVKAARGYDVLSGLAVKAKVMRNKKVWNQILKKAGPEARGDPEAMQAAIRDVAGDDALNYQPADHHAAKYSVEEGKGSVQYVSGRLDSGDLTEVVASIDRGPSMSDKEKLKLMAVSIHSCGNLSHYGIRSLLLNPDIRVVAIVGCCYNLMTEKLGPPTAKQAYLRPTLQAVNGRIIRESARFDPEGFPLSEKLSTYEGDGVRLNVTARMMACQAIHNWTREESESFFTRHFFRAVLQRIFLERNVVEKVHHGRVSDGDGDGDGDGNDAPRTPFDTSTSPVIIGSLRKSRYSSFKSYVRGVVEKLTTSEDFKKYAAVMHDRMADITDEEIDGYEAQFGPRRHELSVTWTLMAFSAMVSESLIVADRWMFLRENSDVVGQAWVESVFDYQQSPRNLVVVGVKRDDV